LDQNATLVLVVVVVAAAAAAAAAALISSLNIPKAFLISSGAQRNFANTFVLTFLQIYRLRFLN